MAWLLYRAGATDHVIAAGVLHDTIEKAGADIAELRRRFGTRTAALVAAVSEDSRHPGLRQAQGRAPGASRRGRP